MKRARQFLRNWWAWAADVVDAALEDEPPRMSGPNKLDLAMRVERELVARYLRERADVIRSATLTDATRREADVIAAQLETEADRIAGGMHYRGVSKWTP